MAIVKLDIFNSGVWAYRRGLISLIFIAFGGIYWKYEKIDKMMRWWVVVSLLMIYVVLVLEFKEYSDPLICTLTIQPMGIVTSVIACLLIVWLSKNIKEIKFLTFIGINSLGFYFLSGALPNIFSILFRMFPILSMPNTLLLVFIISVLSAYPIVLVLSNYFPWLFDLRLIKKKRNV